MPNFATGTPFTVYDSANVALQGSSPEITGFYSSRPNLVADPNTGSHSADRWVSRSAFQRLDPVTQAGQFGSEGRNAVRGPGISNIDLSLLKTFDSSSERARLQFPRGVLQSGQPRATSDYRTTTWLLKFPVACWRQEHRRLVQFGIKLIY